jgi:AcrR family transcriptional regulator
MHAAPIKARISTAKQRAAQARCDAMVRHARDQIVAVGVDRFNLNEVLRLSGGSKATLVKYFGDRNGLIAAAIGAESRHAVAELELGNIAALPLREALQRALGMVLRFYLSPGAIGLYRAVVSAADPASSEGFYEQGHRVVVDGIADLLDARKGSEVNDLIDSRDVADRMLHAIRAGLYERHLIGIEDNSEAMARADATARRTVDLFLPAIARGQIDSPLPQ